MLPAADTTGYPTPQVHLPLTNGTLNTTPARRGMGQSRAVTALTLWAQLQRERKNSDPNPVSMLKSTPLSSFHPLR